MVEDELVEGNSNISGLVVTGFFEEKTMTNNENNNNFSSVVESSSAYLLPRSRTSRTFFGDGVKESIDAGNSCDSTPKVFVSPFVEGSQQLLFQM